MQISTIKNIIIKFLGRQESFFVLVFVASFTYLQFLQPDRYETIMIIGLKEKQTNNLNLNLPTLDLLNNSASKEIYELRDFIDSKEALVDIDDFMKELLGNNYLASRALDLNSFGKKNNERLAELIDFEVDETSGNLISKVSAFSSKSSRLINLAILNTAIKYYDKKARIDSSVEEANIACAFQILSRQMMANITKDPVQEIINENQEISARAMQIKIFQDYKSKCLEQDKGEQQLFSDALPKFFLENLGSKASEDLARDYFSAVSSLVKKSDVIKVIAEPMEQNSKVKKSSFLFSGIFTFFLILLVNAVRLILRVFLDE